jgi:hypothetical protein
LKGSTLRTPLWRRRLRRKEHHRCRNRLLARKGSNSRIGRETHKCKRMGINPIAPLKRGHTDEIAFIRHQLGDQG